MQDPDRRTPVDVDGLIGRHLRRDRLAVRAYTGDALYSAQMRWLRAALILVDGVMDDEGIPAEVRERVVRCVLYGSPDPADAVLRMDAAAATVGTGLPVELRPPDRG